MATWLFRGRLGVTEAAADLARQASRLVLRLRERLAPLRLTGNDAFELESVALVHALAVRAIEGSRFAAAVRDRLQDAFTRAYAERVLRLRLTGSLFVLHRPLEAPVAAAAMRAIAFGSRERLELLDLQDFLCARQSAYRDRGLEETVDLYLGHIEARRVFEPMFSLAVFVTDSGDALRQQLDDLWHTKYLV